MNLGFEVLGPLRATVAGRTVVLDRPRQQALLCVLLTRAGRPVPPAELIDALWGNEPPATGRQVIFTYVCRLRRALGERVVVTEGGGYAVRPGRLDLTEFVDATERSQALLERGDTAAARRKLDEARALWRGEPFAGLPGPGLEAERAALDERWRDLREAGVRIDLMQGRSAPAIAALRAMITQSPFRERCRTLLMAALQRTGRQAEALAEYARFRELLVEELGTSPGLELVAMHQAVLVDDHRLVARLSGFTERALAFGRRCDLPAAPELHGRDRELFTLGGPAVPMIAVDGAPGVGKTAFALTLARRFARPDGRFYLDLCGHRSGVRPKEPAAVLREALLAAGFTDGDIPSGCDERAALWRAFLADRRVLLMLDDALDADQVLPLLPGTNGSTVIVVSRSKLITLPATHTLTLGPLDDAAARQVLLTALGDRVLSEDETTALIEACEGLPLSLVLSGRVLRHRRNVWPAELAGPGGLELLEQGQEGVLSAITHSLRRLDPASIRLLCQVIRTGRPLDAVPARLADSNLFGERADVSRSVAAALRRCGTLLPAVTHGHHVDAGGKRGAHVQGLRLVPDPRAGR